MLRRCTPLLLALALAATPASAQIRKGIPKVKQNKKKQARMVDRFNQMSPTEREKLLKKLPEERRKQLEANRQKYERLDAGEKARLNGQYDTFQQLPPERQRAARQAFRSMNQLPQERKTVVRREVNQLRRLPEAERKTKISSEDFKAKYSADEQKVIEELSSLPVNNQQ